MMINFTQFLRPNGRPVSVSIDRPTEVEKRAEKIIEAGYRFEIEELSTGQVSMTITGWNPETDEEGDVAHRICANGPDVPSTVDDMIMKFKIPARVDPT